MRNVCNSHRLRDTDPENRKIRLVTEPCAGQASGSRQSSQSSSTTVKFKCPKCPTVLVNKKNLDTHLRGHLMKDVTSKAPSEAQMQQEMPNLINSVLSELIIEPMIGEIGQLCHDLCVTIHKKITEDVTGAAAELSEYPTSVFVEILSQNKALFPSSIKSTMYAGSNKLLSSSNFLEVMSGHITVFCDQSENEDGIRNVFIGNFVLLLTRKILIFAVRTMQGASSLSDSVREKRSSDKIDSKEFQQLVYHIGGSIISGFLWKGQQYSDHSKSWSSFCEVLRSRFLRMKDQANQCSDEIRAHTEKTSRGGLKHCSDSAFEFFLVMFDYLMTLESEDGLLPNDVIDKYVLQHDVLLCLWDVLVGNDLSEIDSLDLLVQITQSCVRVTMKGIMKRSLNKVLTKAYSSVAHRSRLAK